MAISALEIRYVLLEWTEGEDRGAHSILALDCVRNFSVKIFLKGLIKPRNWWNGEKAANPGRCTKPELLTWQVCYTLTLADVM